MALLLERQLTKFRTGRTTHPLLGGGGGGGASSWSRRCLAGGVDTSTSSAFNRDLKCKQRNNAARAHLAWKDGEDVVDYNYFRKEMAFRLVDRLDDIKRDEGFPLALDIGAGPGYIHQAICSDDAFEGEAGGIGGVRKLVQIDSSDSLLHRDEFDLIQGGHRCDTYRLHADEEGRLPFPDGTFDLVLSSQAMHWINDLPGLFKEVKVSAVKR